MYPILAVGITLAVVTFSPSVVFALLLSISLFKLTLRYRFPALMEGFLYDMAVASVTFVGVLVHRLRFGGRGWPVSWGPMLCWLLLIAMMAFRAAGQSGL